MSSPNRELCLIYDKAIEAFKMLELPEETLSDTTTKVATLTTPIVHALKAKNPKEREIHVLQLQTVKGLIDSAKADQDQLKAYKTAVAAIKMPKAV